MKWVFLRFKLASFLPWSDVRRIPLVRVGGLSINVTESLSSSKGRKHNKTSGSIGDISSGDSSRGSGGGGGGGGGDTSRHDETDNFPSADWLEGREQQDLQEDQGAGGIAATAMGRAGAGGRENTSGSGGGNKTQKSRRPPLLSQQSSLFDKMDSWAHQGRRSSRTRFSPVESDVSGSGSRGDGYEWERVAQATLEHAFGHEFTAKYQVGLYFLIFFSVMRFPIFRGEKVKSRRGAGRQWCSSGKCTHMCTATVCLLGSTALIG